MIFHWNCDLPESSSAEKLSAAVSLIRRRCPGPINIDEQKIKHLVNSIDNICQFRYKSELPRAGGEPVVADVKLILLAAWSIRDRVHWDPTPAAGAAGASVRWRDARSLRAARRIAVIAKPFILAKEICAGRAKSLRDKKRLRDHGAIAGERSVRPRGARCAVVRLVRWRAPGAPARAGAGGAGAWCGGACGAPG